MKIIKKYDYNDKDLIRIWNEFYFENQCIFPYSSRLYNDIVKNCFKFKLSNYLNKDAFIVFYNNDVPKILLPLVERSDKLKFYGEDTQAGHLDFLYSGNVTTDDFDNLFLLIKRQYNGKRLCLKRINERSMLSKYLLSKLEDNVKVTFKRPCVNIAFNDIYQEYFNSLSKNNRQNIRTAYNKLNKEGVIFYLKCSCGSQINRSVIKKQMDVYYKRALEQRNKEKGFIGKIKQLYLDPITIACMKLDNAISFDFYVNDDLAAFMIGFKTNFNSVVIPRLAINSQYAKYMPGKLLINESIKYLIEQSDIRNIDLSRGDEKYKYDMGGETHYNYDFEIVL